jgi:hypothetical protein
MALNSNSPGVVFYRGPRIVVTSRYIHNADARYRVCDLGQVRRIHEVAYPARTIALICGGIELAIAAPLAIAFGSWVLLCVGLVTAISVGAAQIVDGRRNPRWMALHTVHQGREVTLFQSRKHQEFEQVRRAVIRAIEANEQPRPHRVPIPPDQIPYDQIPYDHVQRDQLPPGQAQRGQIPRGGQAQRDQIERDRKSLGPHRSDQRWQIPRDRVLDDQ